MPYGLLHRIRRQVVWVVAGIAGLAVAAIVLTAAPTLPIIGAALATIAVAVQSLGRELKVDRCMNCGESLVSQPRGAHGVICPRCGSLDEGKRA